MEAVCSQCKTKTSHDRYEGAVPAFAIECSYLICRSCGGIFNAINSEAYVEDETRDICRELLKFSAIRIGCYIFGPGSAGQGNTFKYEYEKRLQLKESLPKSPYVSVIIEWAKFPEEDMPTGARSPTGPLTRQEVRLVKRSASRGICPILFFLIYSPGTIAELDVAETFPRNSCVFVRDSLKHSLVGQDKIVKLVEQGTSFFYYSSQDGCHLRAFAEDFLITKLERLLDLFTQQEKASQELLSFGALQRKRGRK